MLLPYAEQTPLYSATNFNLPTWGVEANSTGVVLVQINVFLCPSDGYSGGGGRTSTTTPPASARPPTSCTRGATRGPPDYNQVPTGSTGLFAFNRPYGVRCCTDGTSNTVAYAEWLVGDGRGFQLGGANPASKYRGNLSTGVDSSDDPGSNGPRPPGRVHQSATRLRRPPGLRPGLPDHEQHQRHEGLAVGPGASGYSMFNVLQTPNDKQYPIGGCRTNFQVGGGPWPDSSFSVGAASNHPGGCNGLVAGAGGIAIRAGTRRAPRPPGAEPRPLRRRGAAALDLALGGQGAHATEARETLVNLYKIQGRFDEARARCWAWGSYGDRPAC